MRTRTRKISCLTLAAALLAGQNVMAAKIYQWTDEEGTVHFSDTPPKGDASREIQEMEYPAYAASETGNDEYSILNQLERMTEWRRQTEDERMARKQLQLEEKRLVQEQHANRYHNLPASTYTRPIYYYPYSGYFSGFSKWHNPHWKHAPGPGKGGHGGFKGHSNQVFQSSHAIF